MNQRAQELHLETARPHRHGPASSRTPTEFRLGQRPQKRFDCVSAGVRAFADQEMAATRDHA